jgi:membrane protease YdiL (CAAX protease family)
MSYKQFLMKNKKIISQVFVLMIFSLPLISHAGLVNCGNQVDAYGRITDKCTLDSLIRMIDAFMKYALVASFSVLVAVIAWTGFKFITSQGDPSKVKDARSSFKYVIYGIFFMLTCWVIVYTLQTWFLDPDTTDYKNGFLLN